MSRLSAEGSEPPAKRGRDDSKSQDLPEPKICKHDGSLNDGSLNDGSVNLYRIDGDIVLFSSRKDNVVTAFKLHKQILGEHCPVFKNMLSIPSPSQVERYDEKPFVQLHDAAEDLIPFLSMIYNPNAIPERLDFYYEHKNIKAIFELCTKYQADSYLNLMKDRMISIWPRGLREWDDLSPPPPRCDWVLGPQKLDEKDEISHLKDVLPEPCFAIRLARDYNMPQILSAAFYHLYRIWGPALDIKPPVTPEVPWGIAHTLRVDHEYLYPSDLVRLLKGSHNIHKFKEQILYPHPRDNCNEDSESRRERVAMSYTRSAYEAYDLLRLLRSTPKDLCDTCTVYWERQIEQRREDFWKNLPKFFDLGEYRL